MSAPKIESLDVSRKMRAIIEWREKRRSELRQEYLRECLKPTKQYLLVDSAIDRFANMRNLHEYRLKVDARGAGLYIVSTFGVVLLLVYILKSTRKHQEDMLRQGLVKYEDKQNKFI